MKRLFYFQEMTSLDYSLQVGMDRQERMKQIIMKEQNLIYVVCVTLQHDKIYLKANI